VKQPVSLPGSENTILKTTDGGETWVGSSERARVGETRNNLENIWFVSPTTGWVIGSFGTLLHTTDGGENWENAILVLIITYSGSTSLMKAPVGSVGRRA